MYHVQSALLYSMQHVCDSTGHEMSGILWKIGEIIQFSKEKAHTHTYTYIGIRIQRYYNFHTCILHVFSHIYVSIRNVYTFLYTVRFPKAKVEVTKVLRAAHETKQNFLFSHWHSYIAV